MFWRLLLSTSSISTAFGRDAQHAIAPIHNLAFAGDKDVFALRQKDFLRLARVRFQIQKTSA